MTKKVRALLQLHYRYTQQPLDLKMEQQDADLLATHQPLLRLTT